MKIMRALLILAFSCFFPFLHGQDTVRLANCYDKAIQYYPVSRDKNLNEQLSQLRIRNFNASWYPQLSLSAQASYQSDVTHIDLSNVPNLPFTIPIPAKDQYKMTFDINQTIYE